MPSEDNELRAWARMLRRAPLGADPDLHRAYVLAAGRRIVGAERAATKAAAVAGERLPLAERTVTIEGSPGRGVYAAVGVILGLGVGVGLLVGWARRRARVSPSSGTYLTGTDVLSSS